MLRSARSKVTVGRCAAFILLVLLVRPGSSRERPAPAAPDSWTATGPLAYGHANGALAELHARGALLVGGGTNTLNASLVAPYAELYDPVTRRWKSYPEPGAPPPLVPPHAAGVSAVTMANGNVLVIGGVGISNDGIIPPRTVTIGDGFATGHSAIYRPATNDWVPTQDLPSASAHNVGSGAVRLDDDRILFCGGAQGQSFMISSAAPLATSRPTATKKCFIYDPALGRWTRVKDMNRPRVQFGQLILLHDGRVLVVGGEAQIPNTGVRYNSAEVYDPANDTWTLVARPMPGFPDEDGQFADQDADSPQIGSRGRTSLALLPDGRVLVVAGQGQALIPDPGRSGTQARVGARKVLMIIYNVFGFTGADTGKRVVVSGAQASGNNSSAAGFTIVHVLGATGIVVENQGAVAFDANAISWSVVDAPLRHGTGASIGNTFVRHRITGLSGLSGLVATAGTRFLRLGTQGAPDPTNPEDTANPLNHGYMFINRAISDSELEVTMAGADEDFEDKVADRSDGHSGTIAWKVYSRAVFSRKSTLIFDPDHLDDPWTSAAPTSLAVNESIVLPHARGKGVIRFGGGTQIGVGTLFETSAGERYDSASDTWSPIADLPRVDAATPYAGSQGSAMRSKVLSDGTLLTAGGGAGSTATSPPSDPTIAIIGKNGDQRGGVLYEAASMSVRIAHIRPVTTGGYIASSPLSVQVTGNDIKVNLGTGPDALITSTANDVIAAVNGHPAASALITAKPIPGQDGGGIANTTGVSIAGGTFVAVTSAFRGGFVYTPGSGGGQP